MSTARSEEIVVHMLFLAGFVAALVGIAGALMGRASPLRERAAGHGAGLSSPELWASVFTVALPAVTVLGLLGFLAWQARGGR